MQKLIWVNFEVFGMLKMIFVENLNFLPFLCLSNTRLFKSSIQVSVYESTGQVQELFNLCFHHVLNFFLAVIFLDITEHKRLSF